jgi:formyl-CoA transferase
VSLFDALAEWMGSPAYYTQYGGTPPARVGAQHATIAPYGPYTAADGQTLLIAVQNDREWRRVCVDLLDDPTLESSPDFARNSDRVRNRERLNALFAARFARSSSTELIATLDRIGVANARLNSVAQFLDHPVLAERDRWREVATPNGAIRALLPPATLDGIEPRMDPVPGVGEHTEDILRELGHDADGIRHLRTAGAI